MTSDRTIGTRELAVAAVALFASSAAWSQAFPVTFPQLTGVSVRSEVLQESANSYRYAYEVAHDGPALDIGNFRVEIASDPNLQVISRDGLDNSAGGFPSSATFIQEFGPTGIAAVAFPSKPSGWIAVIYRDRSMAWLAINDPSLLSPSETQDGFVSLSRALPGVRASTAEPQILVPNEDELAPFDVSMLEVALEKDKSNAVQKTVGPLAFPTDLTARSLVDIIDGYRQEARAEGWIATQSASDALAGELSSLGTALDDGRFGDARTTALSFLSSVEADSCTTIGCTGKPLTSEAYALMKFNMERLVALLPNTPPDCANALPSAPELWPPNHEFEDVSVSGVSDPDGDEVVITIDSIFQDEGTLAAGSGNDCPDATLGADVMLRRERIGGGDGRVYQIDFTATDSAGVACSGEITVCVPPNQSGAGCVAGPLVHDSTECE